MGKTLNTDVINVGDYWKYELAVEATCECGNKRVIHASELVKLVGDRMALERGRLGTLSRRMKCHVCHRRGPRLHIGRHPT